jgi:hypothetical protein
MQHKIVDNFLPPELFRQVQALLMGGDLSWHYSDVTSGVYTDEQFCYFTHTIYKDNVHHSNYFFNLVPMFDLLGMKSLIRIKCNMYPKNHIVAQDPMHRDFEFPHTAAIFYVNTNNGPTVLHDGTKIAAVANRLLKFDGSLPHCSSRCSDQKVRVNISFNYF